MPRNRRLTLDLAERRELSRWARQTKRDPRRARRARLILELSRGGTVREVAARLGVHPETVRRWRHRFEVHRLAGLERDAPRVHLERRVPPDVEYRILRTSAEPPSSGSPRWTTRSLARQLRVNHMLVHRVWRSHGFRVPNSPADSGPRPDEAPPEVISVFLESPSALAIRVRTTENGVADEPIVPPGYMVPVPDESRSAAYGPGSQVRSSLGLLSTLDRAYERRGPAGTDARWNSPELFVFLRAAAERAEAPGEVHVFFDRPLPVGVPRLDAWVAAHPGVRFHDTDPGEPWTVAIDRWLRSGPLRSALEDRVVTSEPFDAAIERATGRRAPEPGDADQNSA